MKLAILQITNSQRGEHANSLNYNSLNQIISSEGHDIIVHSLVYCYSSAKTQLDFFATTQEIDVVIIAGQCQQTLQEFKAIHSIEGDFVGYNVQDKLYIFTDDLSIVSIKGTIIPCINSKAKSQLRTFVFRAFGLDLATIKEKLASYIKNKNKVVFSFFKVGHLNYEIQIRYSLKAKREAIESLITSSLQALDGNIYAHSSITLAQAILKILTAQNKTLAIAESFTGGAISAELVKTSGASAVLKEGIISYSNSSKTIRLGVKEKTLKLKGVVSVETVHEMAGGVLVASSADYVIATTGNASNTTNGGANEGWRLVSRLACSEDDASPHPHMSADAKQQAGSFFVAVGSQKGVHIYQELIEGTRAEVIDYGVNSALFYLYKNLF